MLVPFSGPPTGISDAPVDFLNNYRHLKKLINRALKEGTPIEDLHLIEKHPSKKDQKSFSRDDLLKLLHTLRRIRTRYQALMKSPVPKELVRDILAKAPADRLPWEDEALEKHEAWKQDLEAIRAEVQKELNDHLTEEFFRQEP